jgi:hypothetical protein
MKSQRKEPKAPRTNKMKCKFVSKENYASKETYVSKESSVPKENITHEAKTR